VTEGLLVDQSRVLGIRHRRRRDFPKREGLSPIPDAGQLLLQRPAGDPVRDERGEQEKTRERGSAPCQAGEDPPGAAADLGGMTGGGAKRGEQAAVLRRRCLGGELAQRGLQGLFRRAAQLLVGRYERREAPSRFLTPQLRWTKRLLRMARVHRDVLRGRWEPRTSLERAGIAQESGEKSRAGAE